MRVLHLEHIYEIALPRYKEYKGSLILSPYSKISYPQLEELLSIADELSSSNPGEYGLPISRRVPKNSLLDKVKAGVVLVSEL